MNEQGTFIDLLIGAAVGLLGFFLNKRDKELDRLTQLTAQQNAQLAAMVKQLESNEKQIAEMGTHVNRWIVDIPEFYRNFPLQLKQDIREEFKPDLEAIREELRFIRNKIS